MIRAAVIGATGYTGAELVRILAGHPKAKLTCLTSRQHAGTPFQNIYPALEGVVDITCETYGPDRVAEVADVAFTALPHKLPMAIVPELLERSVKVIDLSADFRFRDVKEYEAHYQPHTAADWLSQAVYGLSEVYRQEIVGANLIGNPGCYPTSILLPLVPLVKEGLIEPASIIADAKSGVSGAGRSPSLANLFCEVQESYKPYKVAQHRHNPEMNAILGREAGQPVPITFVPHLVPMSRGMLSTIYAIPHGSTSDATIRECLQTYYHQAPFIRICPPERFPDTRHVRGTNTCEMGLRRDGPTGRLILMSVIDNLVKGAAGQAVQNMNLMFGCAENDGLNQVPYPV